MKKNRTGWIAPVIGLFLLTGIAGFFPRLAQADTPLDKRLALVIGNGAYQHTPTLDNPPHDAEDIAALLRQLHFTVLEKHDLARRDFEDALAEFGRQAERVQLALVYYAGHGIQVDGQNYLLPVDAQLQDKRDLRRLIQVEDVLDEASQAQRVGVVILDACRDNPLAEELARSLGPKRSVGINRGLTRNTDTPQNLLIAYATGANDTAADGAGRNSPYTTALKEHLGEPNLDLRLIFGKVRDTVMAATDNRQRPYTYGSLGGDPIILAAGSVPIEQPQPPAATPNGGGLSIDSQPPGAIIYVDGGQLGAAPQSLENLPAGQVTVEAKLSGYQDYREKVWIQTGKHRDIKVILDPDAQKSYLTVKTTPADAHIRIMNIGSAYTDGIELTPGKFDIEVSASGYRTDRQWHTLAAGDQVLTIDLEREQTQSTVTRPATPTPANNLEPAMVEIKGGCFEMGSPESEEGRSDDERQHRVCVDRFAMGPYEVTVKEYRRFVEATGYRTDGEKNTGGRKGCWTYDEDDKEKPWDWRSWVNWKKPNRYQANQDSHPVSCVSWNDAQAYLAWLNKESGQSYRLPTEAEWEYAARAGTKSARYWGEGVDATACRYANIAGDPDWTPGFPCDDGYQWVAPVGQFEANAWGLYDMLGNVWEWTCSEYAEGYAGKEQQCLSKNNASDLLVGRGGSWNYATDGVRAATRYGGTPGTRGLHLGFRVARSL